MKTYFPAQMLDQSTNNTSQKGDTMRFQTAVLAAAGFLSAASISAADTFSVDKDHSQATFQVRHLFSRTRGRFTDFDGTIRLNEKNLEKSSVEFRIQAASIDTDNEKRDEHLRSSDFFDVEHHPEIVFKSEKIERRPAPLRST
jgi:polyisoprenoid-binding protein YceI